MQATEANQLLAHREVLSHSSVQKSEFEQLVHLINAAEFQGCVVADVKWFFKDSTNCLVSYFSFEYKRCAQKYFLSVACLFHHRISHVSHRSIVKVTALHRRTEFFEKISDFLDLFY